MPFDNFDSTEAKQVPATQGLDLVGVHSDRVQSMLTTEPSQKAQRDMPTARLVGLAGVTAGLTELTMNHLGNNSAKLFQESATELMKNASTSGAGFYNALDKLRVYQSSSLVSDINTMSGPLSAATNKQVGHLINHGLYVADSLREKAYASSLMMDSSVGVASEVASLRGQFEKLGAGSVDRAQIMEVMGNDRITLSQAGAKLKTPMTAAELRTFGETGFSKGSLIREEMVKQAASMKVADKIAPAEVILEVAPKWQEKLGTVLAEDAKLARVGAQLDAFKAPSTAELSGALLKAKHLGEPLFPKGEAITTALDDYAKTSQYANRVEAKLSLEQKILHQHASGLNAQMTEELVRSSNTQAFGRGFAKGAIVMTAAIGAGYAIDKMMDREHLAISSPLGMGIDAAAGLTLLAPLPMKIKVPLAIGAIAAPRVLDATGYGDFLRPASLQGDSAWRANAVDAIGLGLAAGLNVDGRIRLGIGAATIIAGRAYNVMNTDNEKTVHELSLDMNNFKIREKK